MASKHLGHFRQANRWSQLSPSGTAPAVRSSHTSVWSDVADGMYVFGGYLVGRGRGLSVNGLCAERAAALHGFAEAIFSMTCTFSTARRREGGICWGCLWVNFARHENVCETSCQRSTCLAPPFFDIFVVVSFLCPCLETHVNVGMRACMQCGCKHGLICLSLNLTKRLVVGTL